MFERFTDKARRVLVRAQEEAGHHGHNWIGTEHILLGLLVDHDTVAAQALDALGVDRDDVRRAVDRSFSDERASPAVSMAFTPRAKKVLELSLREALTLQHNYIGTEHMLIALVREEEGAAGTVLRARGVTLDRVRREVVALVGGRVRDEPRQGARDRTRSPAAEVLRANEVRRAGSSPVGTQHVLLAMFDDENSLAARTLRALGLTEQAIAAKIEEVGVAGTTDDIPD